MSNEDVSSVCEEKVFQEVHKAHAVSLRNFLYYKYGDLEKARDYAQDAFIKLWNNCKSVSFGKAKSYLYVVANRLFLDDLSHEKVKMKFQMRQSMTESRLESNPEHLYREQEFKESLEAAISDLPERQRTVFLMSRIDKMSNKEIAEALEISVKGVEKNITQALKGLRLKLDELKNIRI